MLAMVPFVAWRLVALQIAHETLILRWSLNCSCFSLSLMKYMIWRIVAVELTFPIGSRNLFLSRLGNLSVVKALGTLGLRSEK